MTFTVRNVSTGEVAIVDSLDGHDDPTVWEQLAAPPPPPGDAGPFVLAGNAFVAAPPNETPITLVQLYTPTELAALWTLAGSDGRVAGLLIAAICAREIDFASLAFTTGLQLAVAAGVLTPERAARIAAGLPPVTT